MHDLLGASARPADDLPRMSARPAVARRAAVGDNIGMEDATR